MDMTKKGMGRSGYCMSCGGKMAEHGCLQCKGRDKSEHEESTKLGKEPQHSKDKGRNHD